MTKLRFSWEEIRTSLWFLPSVLTVGAMGLATLTVWLDQREFLTPSPGWFILTAGAEGARGVLSTIAGSIITVTGVVFSITIVVLQLASSQFSPRVLRSFTEDRMNQLVLGVFIGTFTYALIVLRTVRSAFDDYQRFVPFLSVNVALLLALVSIGFLIYFVNHIAKSIEAETIIARLTRDALQVIDELFPEPVGAPTPDTVPAQEWSSSPAMVQIRATHGGYIQSVDHDMILKFAERHDLVARVEQKMGAFVIAGDPLISIIRAGDAELPIERLADTIRLGNERTRYQDVQRGLIELTDIAVRALSPGINDPTTALACIDRLTELYAELGMRRFPAEHRRGEDGRVHLIVPQRTFDELVRVSYGPIRENAQGKLALGRRLIQSLERLIARLPAERHSVLLAELARTQRDFQDRFNEE